MVMLRQISKLFFYILILVLIAPAVPYSDVNKNRPHGDRSKLLRGCASCHIGHGRYNTPMLPERKEDFCFRCHGYSSNVEKTRGLGKLSSSSKSRDIQTEFEKPYRHPVEKIGIHRHGEILPELDPSMPRHAECRDCHHHHFVTTDNKTEGIMGTNRYNLRNNTVSFEYELCFNCHSRSANLPVDQTDKAEMFDVSNPSFHPVTEVGKNQDVPSLISPLTTESIIKCTDCHNNNDPSGPRGPHASIYKYILTKNFTSHDGEDEGPFRYELCYGCHRRDSILGNESFSYHELHISEGRLSCRSCHNPHGSRENSHLIDFNSISVSPSSNGELIYVYLGHRSGQCSLTCHSKNHNAVTYPGGLR